MRSDASGEIGFGAVEDDTAHGRLLAAERLSDDPAAFRRRLDRLVDAFVQRGLRPPSDDELAAIAPLLACGDAPAQRLRASPRYVSWLSRTPYLEEERPAASFREGIAHSIARLDDDDLDGCWRLLRRFRQREMLRIALRDLSRRAPLPTIVRELSHLADALVGAALAFVDRRIAPRFGESLLPHFCVLAMGKHGGRELNYSSDIDVLFVYDENARTPSGGSRREQAVKVAENLMRALSEVTEDGFAFRVDANLRPEGRAGPLSHSFLEMELYYERAGQTWERAALIKARHCAGSEALSAEVLEMVRPFVWRRALDLAAVEAIAGMKERIDRARAHLTHDDVKLGRGGIREIEFFVQAFQLLHGGRKPSLRVRGTLEALEALVFSGQVAARDRDALAEAYVFLRDVEHRVQLPGDRQTHALPPEADRAARTALARRMGFVDATAFETTLARHRNEVHSRFSALFATATDAAPVRPEIQQALDSDAPDEARDGALAALGFAFPDRARANLDRLARHPEGAFGPRGRERHPRLAERLLEEMAGSPDPDQALTRFAGLPTSLWAPRVVNDLLASNFATARLLVLLFASTEAVARDFQLHPELLDTLVRSDAAALVRERDDLAREVRERLSRLEDPEERLGLLRRVRNEETLRITLHHLAGRLGQTEVGAQLTMTAEVLVAEALAMARTEIGRRYGEPDDPRFTVFALGSFGGAELDYESDLDLVFVHDGKGETSGGTHSAITASEWAARVAQRFLSHLTVPLAEGVLYRVDARLRPSGSQGPLVTSLRALADYHGVTAFGVTASGIPSHGVTANGSTDRERRSGAALWERQALIRARHVCGDVTLAEQVVLDVLEPSVFGRSLPSDTAAQIDEMRRNLEPEPHADRLDVKKSPGGLLDVQFAAQYLQLRHRVRAQSTRLALTRLSSAGVIEPDLAVELRRSYDFLRLVESRLRLTYGRADVFVPTHGAGLERLARSLGERGADAGERLVHKLRRAMERTRAIFNEVVR